MPLANFFKRGSRKGPEKPSQNGVCSKTTPQQLQEAEQNKSKIVEERTVETILVKDKENNQGFSEPITTSTDNTLKSTTSEKVSNSNSLREEKNDENCEHSESSKLEKQSIAECLQPTKTELVKDKENDQEVSEPIVTSSENTLKSTTSEKVSNIISSREEKNDENCEHSESSKLEKQSIAECLQPTKTELVKDKENDQEVNEPIVTSSENTLKSTTSEKVSNIISSREGKNDENCEHGESSTLEKQSIAECLQPIKTKLVKDKGNDQEFSEPIIISSENTLKSTTSEGINKSISSHQVKNSNNCERNESSELGNQPISESLIPNDMKPSKSCEKSVETIDEDKNETTTSQIASQANEQYEESRNMLHDYCGKSNDTSISNFSTKKDLTDGSNLIQSESCLSKTENDENPIQNFSSKEDALSMENKSVTDNGDESAHESQLDEIHSISNNVDKNQETITEKATSVSCPIQMSSEKLENRLTSEISFTTENIPTNHTENSKDINETVKNIALEVPRMTEFELHNQIHENRLMKSSITSNNHEDSVLDEEKDLQNVAFGIPQIAEVQLHNQIHENELMKSSITSDDHADSARLLDEQKDLQHDKDDQEKTLQLKESSTNSTFSLKNGEEQDIEQNLEEDIEQNMEQDIEQNIEQNVEQDIEQNREQDIEQKQNNSKSNQEMLEPTPAKKMHEPLATKECDSSIYSEFCEKLAADAVQQALTEVNLIMFEDDEIKDVNIQEPPDVVDEVRCVNIEKLPDVGDEVKNVNIEELPDVGDKVNNVNIEELPDVEVEVRNIAIEKPPDVGDSHSILTDSEDLTEDIPSQPHQLETNSNQNWKVGYLEVKLSAKLRGKVKLKAWQKRWVVIQADEFTSDKKNCNLMLSVYHSESGNSRRHSALFWKSVSSKKAVVYRSMSKTHPYAFTVAYDREILLHLAGSSEAETQEWISAIRNILWPPNPVMQLEKVLNGNEFDVSFIDNDFSYRAGLLGTYGCLSVTNRKLILTHPQMGHVIQEWYLNTVDKFQILPQPKEEDTNKVLIMHTSRDSSTGLGELRLYCNEAVSFLKSLASTIHKVLQYHCKGNNSEKYHKELEEISAWLTPQPSPVMNRTCEDEDYYKVPKRQVRSLLDIPNFIFDKPIGQTTSSCDPLTVTANRLSTERPKLTPSLTSVSTFSQDSGISTATSSSDFLNCSQTSFSIGGSEIPRLGKYESSSCESLDEYTPPHSPVLDRNCRKEENVAKTENVM